MNSEIRSASIFAFSFFLLNFSTLFSQNISTVKQIQKLIEQDSLAKAKTEVSQNIAYFKKEQKFDSLVKYIQFEGSFKLNNGNKQLAIKKAEGLVSEIKNSGDNLAINEAFKELSWIYDLSGNTQKAYDIVFESLEYAKKINDPQSTALASTYYKLGYLAANLGNFPLANKNYQQALQLLRKTEKKDFEFYNQIYNALGGIKWQEAKLDSAKFYFEAALKVLEKTDGADIMNQYYRPALIKMNLAVLGNALGKNREAIEYSEKAIAGFQKYIEKSTDEARILKAKGNLFMSTDNLAAFYNTLGEYARSQQLIEHSYEQKKKFYEKGDINLIISQIILAEAKIASRDFEGAAKNADQALQSLKTSPGANLYWEAAALSTRANIYEIEGDIENAEAFYEKSEATYRKSLDGYPQGFLDSMLEQSLFYASNNKGKKALQLANEMYEATHTGDYKNTIQQFYHTLNLAQVHYKLKNYKDALQFSEEALKFNSAAGLDGISTTDSILGQYRKPMALLINASAKYYLEKNKSEVFLKELLKSLEDGISILDQRKKVVNNQEDVKLLIAENEELLNFAKKIRLKLFEITKEEKYLDKVIALHESSIYSRIRSRLNLRDNIAFNNIPQKILTREQNLKSGLTTALDGPGNGLLNYFEISRQWNSFLDSLRREYPKYYKMRYATLEEPIADLQQNIPTNTTVIRYLFIEDDLYAFVVSANAKQIFKLVYEPIKNHIAALQQSNFSTTQSRTLLYELYRALFHPIEKAVRTKKIIIFPDRDLFNLSFETLTPKPLKNFQEFATNSLLAKYDISYNFSLLLYKDMRAEKNFSEKYIAFAPGFNHQMKQKYQQSVIDSSKMDKSYLTLLPQPFSEDLVKQYAKIFNGEYFINENASKQHFIDNAREHRIIHIGTHAESNNLSPELSRLIFAKDYESGNAYDENSLYSYEIYNINLSSNLAILTACETGKPTYQAGEGMISLSHAFNYAGSESILTSLWEIDEQSSAKIVKLFYENLADGMPKDEALRKAKLDYIATAQGRTSAPQYWAGLVLIGDTSPIDLSRGLDWWWYALAAIVGISLLIFLLQNRKRTF
ncbi:CHAT domain-containing protein [Aequorivita echinoideorum]|uniref:CHAT domain-containing protein n=1 Tax=Aequorivita echinoideorum TaxID=1549647 RepID=A0ABS5S0M6_9FLAO|nr:CHAT domain-containing protein [Aequorivita echinoideorum]MBT0606773.1 CHAT domain-containing protein [Aequorivita echinoideorum]